MTRVLEFVIALLIVIALFVVIALFLPAKRAFSYSIETNRPMSTVNDLVNGFSRFKDWNPLLRHDPNLQYQVSGPTMGTGAKIEYSSNKRRIGSGSWTIVESIPGELVKYELQNNARGTDKSMTIRLERTGQRNQNVKITQEYRVHYGWDIIGRYAGMYASRNVGDDIKRGLDKLSNLLATVPKFDYTSHPGEFHFADIEAQNVLLVTTAAKRNNDEIALAMQNQVAWIKKVMDANGLVAAGPLRIVTNEFTSQTYGFDVVQPVRRRAPGDAAPEADDADDEADEADDAAEGEEGEAPATEMSEGMAEAASVDAPKPVSGPLEVLTVKLEGPVQLEQQPARRVATTDYTGPAPGLPRVRDQLRAWAMTRGADVADRPFEEYLDPIPDMLNEDARFKVYWPIK
jgi:effector-binding domain-containing protein